MSRPDPQFVGSNNFALALKWVMFYHFFKGRKGIEENERKYTHYKIFR
jgi:hypothetical protein